MKVLTIKGQIPWNKGTKGIMKAWNKGLTKEIDSRIKPAWNKGKNLRLNPKGEFKKGNIPWNKDLGGIHLSQKSEFKVGHKNSDETRKLLSKGLRSSEKVNNRNLSFREKISLRLKESWKNPNSKYRTTDKYKKRDTTEHDNTVLEKSKELENEGYKCILIDKIRPDIIALKDGKIISVEVEKCTNYRYKKDKYKKFNASKYYDSILWITNICSKYGKKEIFQKL